MVDVKFGVVLGDILMSATECARIGVKVEEYGYDSIWIPDHLVDVDGAIVNPYTIFGYLTALTKKLFFCSAVSDCQRIHPAEMAHMIATLDHLGQGRIGLGIGAGEAMSTKPYGMPFEDDPNIRVERLREYIQVVKLLWSSSPQNHVNFSGKHFRLTDAWLDQPVYTKPHPPIIVGALGAKRALRVAAELGDGWLPFFSTPEYYRKRLNFIKEVAKSVGRDPEKIEPIAWVYLIMSKDPDVIKKHSSTLAIYSIAERGSIKDLGVKLSKEFSIDYNYARLLVSDSSKIDELVKVAEELPIEVVKKMHALGSPEEIIEFFDAQIKAGARHFIINPSVSPNIDEQLKEFSEKIMPHFKEK